MAVLSEWLFGCRDEGIRAFAFRLCDEWAENHRLLAMCCGPEAETAREVPGNSLPVARVRTNRLFLSLRLRSLLGGFRPDLVFYVSPSCASLAALARARVAKALAPRARVFVVALQPTEYGRAGRLLLRLLSPDGVFVQSPRSLEDLKALSCPVHFLPSGVDLGKFVSADPATKARLRQKHGVDPGAFVVLHVGHISRDRNVQLLAKVAGAGGIEAVVVGSSSTPQDATVVEELALAGVRVIRKHLPRVEELYQLADLYLFPVTVESAAIGVPLSVLEAMACNLPVLTTRFGGLPSMFREDKDFAYFDQEGQVPELVDKMRDLDECSTRRRVEPYGWGEVAREVLRLATLERTLP